MTRQVQVAAGFTGFGEGAVEFYDGLLADNSKAYWTDHRAAYERDVLAPMQALLATLEPEFGSGKIFRPYRDVRFSKDKSPYKTACGAIVGPFYVQVSAEGLLAAAGGYQWAPDQLTRYRTAVDDERRGTDLAARLDRIATTDVHGVPLTIAGDRLATRPRGVAPDHPRLDLLPVPQPVRPPRLDAGRHPARAGGGAAGDGGVAGRAPVDRLARRPRRPRGHTLTTPGTALWLRSAIHGRAGQHDGSKVRSTATCPSRCGHDCDFHRTASRTVIVPVCGVGCRL